MTKTLLSPNTFEAFVESKNVEAELQNPTLAEYVYLWDQFASGA